MILASITNTIILIDIEFKIIKPSYGFTTQFILSLDFNALDNIILDIREQAINVNV